MPRSPRSPCSLAVHALLILISCGGLAPAAWSDPLIWTRYPIPPAQDHHAAVVDPVTHRLYIQGGAQPSTSKPSPETWSLSLDGVPRWHFEGPGDFLRRHSHSAVYDSAGGRIVIYGGTIDGVMLSDSYWLSPPNTSWSFIGSGAPPYAPTAFGWSSRHSVVDTKRRRMLVVDVQGMVFSLDLATGVWGTLDAEGEAPIATPSYSGAVGAVCYDTRRDRLICTDPVSGIRVLSLDGTPTWSARPTTGGPTPGSLGTLVYDVRRDRAMLVLPHAQVWQLSFGVTDVWTPITPPVVPPGNRTDAPAAYDERGDQVVWFGGLGRNDTWAFSLSTNTWSLVHPGGGLPVVANPTAAVAPLQDAMYVFGTSGGTWRFALDQSGFTQLNILGNGPTARPAALYDALRGRIIVFSNSAVAGLVPEIHTLPLTNPLAWGRILPSGTPPAPRSDARATYDAVHDRLIVYGGTGVNGLPLNDVWAVSLSGSPVWVRLCDGAGMPATYNGMQMVHDPRRDRIIALGPSSVDGLTHAWALSLDGGTAWTPMAGGAGTTQRFFFAAAADSVGDRVILHGGQSSDGTSMLGSASSLVLSPTEQWLGLAPQGVPPVGRYGHTLTRDLARNRFVLFGGREGDEGVVNPISAWSGVGVYLLDNAASVLGAPPREPAAHSLALTRARLLGADRIAASVHLQNTGEIVLEATDIMGRSLGSTRMSVAAGDHEVTLTLPRSLAPGLCLVTVRQGEQRSTRKLAVVR